MRTEVEADQSGRSDAIEFESNPYWREFARPLPLEIRALGLPVSHHAKRTRTMQAATTHDPAVWINVRAVSAITGLSPHTVRRLGREGVVTTRKFPGTRPLYYKPEVEALARQSTRGGAYATA